MSTIETGEFKERLLEERQRLRRRSRTCAASTRARSTTRRRAFRRRQPSRRLGTETFDRELDEGLEEGAQQTARADRRRARADRGRLVRHVRRLRQADRRRAPAGGPVGDALHRRPAQAGRDRLDRGAARARSTSASARRRTRSCPSRPPSGRSRPGPPSGWGSAPSPSPRTRPTRSTKQIVAHQLPFGHETHVLGPFSLHHVQNTGIASACSRTRPRS